MSGINNCCLVLIIPLEDWNEMSVWSVEVSMMGSVRLGHNYLLG
jgi:hypothetical protein